MIKISINLLPREIKDKQRGQKAMALALLGLVAVAGILAAIYTFNSWQIRVAEDQVTMLNDQTSRMNTVIQGLRVYEQRAQEFQSRKQIVDKALADKIEWSKLLEELMVVTPNNVSLVSLSGSSDGITFSGSVLDPLDDPDNGHKPVATWLTKLVDITPQPDVWLSSSNKQGSMIQFSNAIKFKKSPTLPAPPNVSGK